MKLNRHRLWEFIKDFFAINLGMAIYSLGWAAFLLPYHITTGGMVGLFAILYYVRKKYVTNIQSTPFFQNFRKKICHE